MKISVVIPSLNCGEYLGYCLGSIFNQDYDNYEVIVVDGYSEDNSQKVLKYFKRSYPEKLTVALRKPQGQSDAINVGMDMATGDIVAYICADDTYEPCCFGKVATAFVAYPWAQWVYGKGKIIDGDGREVRSSITKFKGLAQSIYSYCTLQCIDYIVQPTVFMRRGLYQRVGRFNHSLKYCMDYDYWLRAGLVGMPVFIDYHLANWRAHKGALSVREYREEAKEALDTQRRFSGSWLRPAQWAVYLVTIMLYRSMEKDD